MDPTTQERASQLIRQFYPDFNQRNIDQIMPHFTADIDWPNGMTGGRERGHAAVRAYWTNQWQQINSQVTPISYRLVDDRVILEVHQLIKDMNGSVISDSVVFHTYRFSAEKIAGMDISEQVPDFGRAISPIPT